MATHKKGSAAAKAFMAKLRSMKKGAKKTKSIAKKVKAVAKKTAHKKAHVSGYLGTKRHGNKTAVFYKRISGLFDTTIINDLDQLKKEYFRLAKKYHPDAGGTKEQFQQLQLEYEKHQKTLLQGSNLNHEQQQNELVLDEALRNAVNAIISLPNISIELVGKWIWVGGNTYPIRNELKQAGFMFASAKKRWYFAGVESAGRGQMSLEEIKSKYGSTKIDSKDSKKYLSGVEYKLPLAKRKKFLANLKKATKALSKRPI